jgi:JAB1/Mov34/MPN/PAD-1 ubiquitin protease
MTPAKAKSITPAMATSAEFGFASWSAPEVAWTIEYPPEVMDEIRAYACHELLQLSHGGAEVAGVLFGAQRPGAIRILTWRPIASEYEDGETLRLSHRDRMNLAVQLEVARANPELKELRPVGWFVSHPHGAVAMTPADLEVHSGFFPGSAQVTLVIRPTDGGHAEAGFFVREADGSLQSDASYRSFSLEPVKAQPAQAPPAAASDTKPESQEITASESDGPPANVPGPSVPSPRLAAPSLAAPSLAAPSLAAPSLAAPSLAAGRISPTSLATPTFETHEPLPARERWLWAVPIALALGLAAWMLFRQKPAESSPMAFRVSSNAARIVQLEWDPNSRAVRDSERGEIDITDDGKTSQVLFTSDQLHSGKMTYLAQSGDVGFQLTVYPASGAPVHETTRLIAPASSTAIEPPQLLGHDSPALPARAGASGGAEDDALQQQVRRLTEDLRRERARSSQLQNLNRILENRLGIQPDAAKAKP